MTVRSMRLLATFTLVTAMSGCTLFPDRPAQRIFQLPEPAVTASSEKPIPVSLRIATPHAEAPTDSRRILVKPAGNEINVYQGVRWANTAPVVFRDHLIGFMRSTGRFETVINDNSAARSDLTLAGDLTSFLSEYREQQPVVRIQFDAQLVDEQTRNTLDARRFTVEERSRSENPEAVVEAFGRASDALARQVEDWLTAQVSER